MRATRLRLEEVVLQPGGIQTGPFGSQLHAHEYVPEGVGVIMPADMSAGRISHSSAARVSDSTSDRLKRHRVKAGDVLISRRGDIGRFAVVTDAEQGWLCGTGCLRVRFPDSIRPTYAAMIFESHESQKWLQRNAVGQTMLNLSASILADLPFIVRDTAEQDRWALCYESLSQLKCLLEKEIAAKGELKRGLMQQLLTGKKRFPEFHAQPWHFSRLSDHVTTVTRRNLNGLTLVLTASGEHGLVDQRRYFNRNVAGADLTKYHLLKKGEFAYNRSAMNGYPYGATKRLDEHEEGALSTLYLCFAIADSKLDSDYLKHVFESGILNRQLRPIVRVGARAHGLLNVTDDDFLSISIPFPALGEQRRIADVLNALDQEIDLLTARREKIEDYKRGLLSKLLSGEIPVPA